MELGVNSAVLHYNEGACGISNVFSYLKLIMVIIWKKVASKKIKLV